MDGKTEAVGVDLADKFGEFLYGVNMSITSIHKSTGVGTYHSSHNHGLGNKLDLLLILLRPWTILCHWAEAEIDLHEFVIS